MLKRLRDRFRAWWRNEHRTARNAARGRIWQRNDEPNIAARGRAIASITLRIIRRKD